MATLVEQIRQMIDALAVVDPEAAAEFRGGSQNRPSPAAQSRAASPDIVQVPMLRKNAAKQSQSKISSADAIRPCNSEMNPLCINPMTDSLVKGIIYSEILGKPVSRRHRYGRM